MSAVADAVKNREERALKLCTAQSILFIFDVYTLKYGCYIEKDFDLTEMNQRCSSSKVKGARHCRVADLVGVRFRIA